MRQELIDKTEELLKNYVEIVENADFLEIKLGEDAEELKEMDKLILKLNNAIDAVMDDPYYYVIEFVYFEKKTMVDIAKEYNTSTTTLLYNKKRLVEEICKNLYIAEYLKESLEEAI